MNTKKIFILSILLILPSFSFAQSVSVRALKDNGEIQSEELPMEDVGSAKKQLGLSDHLKIQQIVRGIDMPTKFGVNKITDAPVAKEVESHSAFPNKENLSQENLSQESVSVQKITQERLSDEVVVGREIEMESISTLPPKSLPPLPDVGAPPTMLPPRGLPPLPSGAIYNESIPSVVNNPSKTSGNSRTSNNSNSNRRNQTRVGSSTVATIQYGQDPEKKAKFEGCINDLKAETRGKNVRIVRNDKQAYIISWSKNGSLTEDSCFFNSN